jgi:hypothetical protein
VSVELRESEFRYGMYELTLQVFWRLIWVFVVCVVASWCGMFGSGCGVTSRKVKPFAVRADPISGDREDHFLHHSHRLWGILEYWKFLMPFDYGECRALEMYSKTT